MQIVDPLIHPFRMILSVLLIGSLFDSSCQASLNKVPNEKQILKYIVEESKKEEDDRDKTVLKLVWDFVYQKTKGYAEKDKAFAEGLDYFTFEDEDEPVAEYVDLTPLGEKYILLGITRNIGYKTTTYVLFLIHNEKCDWIPIQLDINPTEREGTYRCLNCTRFDYSAPLLFIEYRGGGAQSIGSVVGNRDVLLFKGGSFKRLLTAHTYLQEEEFSHAQNLHPNVDCQDYFVSDITFTNQDIFQLYKSCNPKGEGLKNLKKLWKEIYIVKAPKIYFHEKAVETTHQKKAFVVRGDAIYVSETKGEWVYGQYRDPKTTEITAGWLKKEDLILLDREIW